jgi:hypothetical protein
VASAAVAEAKPHAHPQRPEQTIWKVFEDGRPPISGTRETAVVSTDFLGL